MASLHYSHVDARHKVSYWTREATTILVTAKSLEHTLRVDFNLLLSFSSTTTRTHFSRVQRRDW